MSHPAENPFAIKQRPRLSPLLSGIKGLAMVGTLFAILVMAQAQSRRWLLERWVMGLAELPVAEQVQRVLQIDALGDIATETIARRLSAADESVAATAFQLLRDHQSAWTSRDSDDLGRAHLNMITGIEAIAEGLSGQRARWATELLNQSLVECVDRDAHEVDQAYQAASRVLALLVPAASDQAIASHPAAPPLPLTDAPPTRPRLVPLSVRLQTVDMPTLSGQRRTDAPQVAMAPAAQPHIAVIPSTSTAEETNQPLADRSAPNERSADRQEHDTVQPVRHLTHSSLETFDTKSVIALLGHPQADTRDHAVDELVRRGLSNEEIRIGNQLASPLVDVRLGLLKSIIHRSDLDPRPWLLWLAEDSNREVRMQAISTLATMNDPAITLALQKRLQSEHDSAVSAHIRRAVEVR